MASSGKETCNGILYPNITVCYWVGVFWILDGLVILNGILNLGYCGGFI